MFFNKNLNLLKGLCFVGIGIAYLSATAVEMKSAEKEGFSAEGLQRLDHAMQTPVREKKLAGVVTLLARHGQLIQLNTVGQQNLASNTPMKPDTIFRIFSMTKPITSVAMMLLYEEGKWQPNDPIDKYIPEFKNLKVFAGVNKDGSLILEKPTHAPTMAELMTHTAGFALGFQDSPVNKLYQKADLFHSPDFKTFIDKVAAMPLDYQPGEQWEYSISSDIQGYLVERLSGIPFPQFLEERIFQPLGMKDTSFVVPQEKRKRLATTYQPDEHGHLIPMWDDEPESTSSVSSTPSAPSVVPSGGGGLFSTVEDFWHFAQMLANGGQLNNTRLLAASSVQMMRTNHLPAHLRKGNFGVGPYQMQEGLGFGYNMGVFDAPNKVNSTVGAGTYFWIGAAGTWFWIDPTNDLLFIGLSQRWMLAPGMPELEKMSHALIYQALEKPDPR